MASAVTPPPADPPPVVDIQTGSPSLEDLVRSELLKLLGKKLEPQDGMPAMDLLGVSNSGQKESVSQVPDPVFSPETDEAAGKSHDASVPFQNLTALPKSGGFVATGESHGIGSTGEQGRKLASSDVCLPSGGVDRKLPESGQSLNPIPGTAQNNPVAGPVGGDSITVFSETLPVSGGKKISWAEIVENEEEGVSAFVINEVDGKQKVFIPQEVTDAKPLWENFVIGSFLNSAPHVANISRIVNGIWRLGDKSKTSPVEVFVMDECTVRFKILEDVVKRRVLHKEIWTIMGMPMIVKPWSPFAVESQPALKSFPLWVHLKNVPPSLISDEGFKFLAKGVGTLRKIHPLTLNCVHLSEARLFVDADLTKDLPREFVFCGLEEGELETNVSYSYPWLPSRCAACGKWGHKADKCVLIKGKSKELDNSGLLPSSTEVDSAMLLLTSASGAPSTSNVDFRAALGKETTSEKLKVTVEITDLSPEAEIVSEDVLNVVAPSATVQSQEDNWEQPAKVCKSLNKSEVPNYDEVNQLIRSRFGSLRDKGERGEEIEESEEDMDEEIEVEGFQDVDETPVVETLVQSNGRPKKTENPNLSNPEGMTTRRSLRKGVKDPPKQNGGGGGQIRLIPLGDTRRRKPP